VGNKSGFSTLGQDDLLFLLGTFSFFQPSLGVSHDDLGLDSILEAMDKSFQEEGICHVLLSKIQVLKGNDKIFHYEDYFNLVRCPKWWVFVSKSSYKSVTNFIQETYS
jgi:hypothetical protein